jgi:iron-sulfur cluster insertion protein
MITVTPAASAKITHILAEEGAKALRIFVQGGGCSGFQYGFTLENNPPAEDDLEIAEINGFYVYIDTMSMQYLDSAVIDYKEELMGARFVIDNPNVTATCGCGSSFAAG